MTTLLAWLLLPILWVAIASVQPESAVTQAPPALQPTFNLDWYAYLLGNPRFTGALWVSISLSLIVMVATIAIASLAAYPLTRCPGPHAGKIMGVLIFTQMVPELVLLIPVLLIYNQFAEVVRLRDTVPGLALINVAFWLPLIIWLLRNYFGEVPRSIEQSARIDGCSRLGTLFRVTIPAAPLRDRRGGHPAAHRHLERVSVRRGAQRLQRRDDHSSNHGRAGDQPGVRGHLHRGSRGGNPRGPRPDHPCHHLQPPPCARPDGGLWKGLRPMIRPRARSAGRWPSLRRQCVSEPEGNLGPRELSVTRRQLLKAGVSAPLAAAFLAACGTSSSTPAATAQPSAAATAAPASAAASAAPSAAASAAASAAPSAAVSAAPSAAASAAASAAPSAAASAAPSAAASAPAENFSGITIKVDTRSGSFDDTGTFKTAKDSWEARTGGKVILHEDDISKDEGLRIHVKNTIILKLLTIHHVKLLFILGNPFRRSVGPFAVCESIITFLKYSTMYSQKNLEATRTVDNEAGQQ